MALKRTFEIEIDGVKESVKNIAQLREEQRRLKQEFEQADFGTATYNQLSRDLQRVNSDLKTVEESVTDITAAEKVEGFVRFGNAAGGALGTAALAAQAFGSSSEEIEKVERSFFVLLGTLETMQLVQEALGKENKFFVSLMNRLGASALETEQGIKRATIASRLFGSVTKAALISTGIGLFVVALGTIIVNFDKLKKKATEFLRSFEPINKAITFFEERIGGFPQLFAGALNAGRRFFEIIGNLVGSIFSDSEARRRALDDAKDLGRELAEAAAEGVAEKQAELDERTRQKFVEIAIKDTERLIALRKARGEATLEIEKANIDREIDLLNAQIELDESLREENFEKIKDLANKKAILIIENEQKIAQEVERIQKELAEDQRKINQSLIDFDPRERRREIARELQETRRLIAQELGKEPTELTTLPVKIDNVELVDVPGIKDTLAEKLAEIFEDLESSDEFQAALDLLFSSVEFTNTLFDNAIDRNRERLDAFREQLSEIDADIAERLGRIDQLEQDLANASGQRREFIISQLRKEREEEKKLQNQKRAASQEEKRLEKEVERQKKQQAILNKSINLAAAISNTARGVTSALAQFPPNVPLAILVGALGAIQTATIAATKPFAKGGIIYNMMKMAAGGIAQTGGYLTGPSHAQGGIPFTVAGVPGFEAEGGEIIVNKGIQSRPDYVHAISEMNFATGGKRFAQEGINLRPNFAAINEGLQNRDGIDKVVDKLDEIKNQRPQVAVTEINEAQNRVDEIFNNVIIN